MPRSQELLESHAKRTYFNHNLCGLQAQLKIALARSYAIITFLHNGKILEFERWQDETGEFRYSVFGTEESFFCLSALRHGYTSRD